jgi:hypothetical protein
LPLPLTVMSPEPFKVRFAPLIVMSPLDFKMMLALPVLSVISSPATSVSFLPMSIV